MPMHGGTVGVVVEWRRLTRTLWVGLGPEGVVGCVEVGRRCVVTDGEGRVFGRFRDLDDAKAMLALLCEERGGPLARRAGRSTASVATGA